MGLGRDSGPVPRSTRNVVAVQQQDARGCDETGISGFCGSVEGRRARRHRRAGEQLGTRMDVQLAVHTREHVLDALRRQERLRRDLLVGEPRGCEIRDSALGLGQLVRSGGADSDP